MLINNDRRAHNRCLLELPFIVNLEPVICRGHTRNISRGGILSRITDGDLSGFEEGVACECFIKNGTKTMGFHCAVIRAAGPDLALQFLELDFDQDMFLRTLIESHS